MHGNTSHTDLRYALSCLAEYPPFALGKSKIAITLYPDQRLVDRGKKVRAMLLDCIELMRPAGRENITERRWMLYHSINYEYSCGMGRLHVLELLAVSASTYTRLKRNALSNLADLLEEHRAKLLPHSRM